MRILVMGGTRMLGEATVVRLLDEGHELTVFNRGTRQPVWADRVSQLTGDRHDPDALARIKDLDVDTVVDFSAYRGIQSRTLVDALPDGAHLIHCSTGSVYAPVPDLPWSEESPLGPWALWGDYAREKLAAERAVAVAADRGHRVTIFRLPYVLGPRNYAPREEFVLNRLLDGEVVAVPGDGKALQQFITADQVGESVAAMVASTGTGMTIYNIADDRALCTTEGFVQLCAEVAGVEVRIVPAPGPTGSTEPFDAVNCVFPFPNESYLLDTTAARRAGFLPRPRPLRHSIGQALEVLLAEPDRRNWERTTAERAILSDRD